MSDLPPGLTAIDDPRPPMPKGLKAIEGDSLPMVQDAKAKQPRRTRAIKPQTPDEVVNQIRQFRAGIVKNELEAYQKLRDSGTAKLSDRDITESANRVADDVMIGMDLPTARDLQEYADLKSSAKDMTKAERMATRFMQSFAEMNASYADFLVNAAPGVSGVKVGEGYRDRAEKLANFAQEESAGWEEAIAPIAAYGVDPLAWAGYGALKNFFKAKGALAPAGRAGQKIVEESALVAMTEAPLAVARGDDDPKLSALLGAAGGAAFRAAGEGVKAAAPNAKQWWSGVNGPNELAEDKLIGKLRGGIKRNLTSAAGLPEDAFDKLNKTRGAMDAELTEMTWQVRELERVIGDTYGGFGKLTDKQIASLDGALKGEVPIGSLPERIRPAITQMRNHVDALSRELIDSGAIEGKMIATVSGNIGEYLTRSYRVFDDPKWFKKVPTEVVNRAKSWIRAEYPGMGDAEVDGLIDKLIRNRETSPLAPLDVGMKDLSILTRRKEIPAELRALMGEYTDPRANYARSVEKMSNLIASHKFLDETRKAGMGRYFFDQPQRVDGVSYSVQIADDGSKRLAPLDGLYTSKEIATAFGDMLGRNELPKWLSHYMKVNGAVKFSKTVGSIMTHIRNLTGNTGFAVANAHWRVGKMAEAFRTTKGKLLNASDGQWKDYYKRLQSLGVVGESANAGELRDVLRDAVGAGWDDLSGNYVKRLAKRTGKALTSVYQAEDDVWKIFAYENEAARYAKAYPNWTPEQVATKAAEIVRNTYPTYSMVPRAVKGLRRWPLTGAFTSFPAEVVRVGYHTLRLAAKELKDPATRQIGAQRLTGIIAAASGTTAIATASRYMTGLDAEQEADFRRFMPPWSENSDLLQLGRTEDGNLRYIDLGYVDPYTYLKQPAMALLRGEDWQQSLIESAIESAQPFLGEEILAGKLLDVSRNTKPTGGRVYNPQAEPIDKWQDIAGHLFDAIEPGTLTSIDRISSGLQGETNPYGKSYDPATESLALFTGQRISEVDVRQALDFKARTFQRGMNDVSQIFNGIMRQRGEVSQQDLNKAYSQAEQSRRRLFAEIHKDASAALRLGVSEVEVRDILSSAGLSQRNIQAIVSNDLPAFTPSTRSIENAIGRAKAVEGNDQAVEQYQKRLRFLEQLNETQNNP